VVDARREALALHEPNAAKQSALTSPVEDLTSSDLRSTPPFARRRESRTLLLGIGAGGVGAGPSMRPALRTLCVA
jgi:hypothetical protein